MGDWKEIELGSALAVHHGFAFPGDGMVDFSGGMPIVVSIGNFDYSGGFRFESTRIRGFSGEYPRRFDLSPGDLLVVMTCQTPGGEILGLPGLVPDDGERYLHNQRIGRVECFPGLLESRYAYYLFLTPELNRQLTSTATGTKILHTSPERICRVRCRVPGIFEQRAIVSVLGALDDKIAVNGRVAVVADALVTARFTALMESSTEPQEAVFGEVASVNCRSVKPNQTGALRYIDIASVGVGSYEWPDRIEWSDAPGRARRLAPVGSTVWSTVRPNRRSHALVLDADEDLVFSTGLAVLTPESVGPAFLYESTRVPAFQAYLEGVAEGSAYPAVRAERFKEAPILLPDPTEREDFEEFAMALRLRAHQAAVESRTLAALRDALLPQLMSGRLRVREAEKIVEDHV